MSLNDEERHIVVNLEKEKALNTFAEIDILYAAAVLQVTDITHFTALFLSVINTRLSMSFLLMNKK